MLAKILTASRTVDNKKREKNAQHLQAKFHSHLETVCQQSTFWKAALQIVFPIYRHPNDQHSKHNLYSLLEKVPGSCLIKHCLLLLKCIPMKMCVTHFSLKTYEYLQIADCNATSSISCLLFSINSVCESIGAKRQTK